MTTRTLLLATVLVAACDKGAADPHEPSVATVATVTLNAVTFADDCGGTPPTSAPTPASPPAPAPAAARVAPSEPAQDMEVPGDSPAVRRCEQTSMQLSIVASGAAEVRVKSVDVFDENGKKLGSLETRSPTRWSDAQSIYEPWDQTVAAGQTALVSYVLAQPTFISNYAPRDRTYTVKVIASVGSITAEGVRRSIDQPLQTSVMVVAQPPPVPT